MKLTSLRWVGLAAGLELVWAGFHGLHDPRHQIVEVIGLLLISALFYLISVREAIEGIRRRWELGVILGAALAFRLTAWPLEPALSDDVYRYRWEGRVQQSGGNPYLARPNDPRWSFLRDETFLRIPGRDFAAVYGPLAEWAERAAAAAAERITSDPWRQAFLAKAPGAVGDLGVIAALVLLMRVRGWPLERLVLYAWSPLPVIEFWGNGHNDSLALAFLVLALAAAARHVWTWAFAALTLAAAAKIWPLFLFPVFAGKPSRRWRSLWVAPVLAAPMAWAFWIRDWPAARDQVRFLSGFLGGWRNFDSAFGGLLKLSGGDLYLAKKFALAAVLCVVAWVVARRWPLERAVLAVVAGLLVFSANCHPWYVAWLCPLLVGAPWPPLLLWTSLAPLGHTAVSAWVILGEWNGVLEERWFVYVPVAALAAAYALRRRGSPTKGLDTKGESI